MSQIEIAHTLVEKEQDRLLLLKCVAENGGQEITVHTLLPSISKQHCCSESVREKTETVIKTSHACEEQEHQGLLLQSCRQGISSQKITAHTCEEQEHQSISGFWHTIEWRGTCRTVLWRTVRSHSAHL